MVKRGLETSSTPRENGTKVINLSKVVKSRRNLKKMRTVVKTRRELQRIKQWVLGGFPNSDLTLLSVKFIILKKSVSQEVLRDLEKCHIPGFNSFINLPTPGIFGTVSAVSGKRCRTVINLGVPNDVIPGIHHGE